MKEKWKLASIQRLFNNIKGCVKLKKYFNLLVDAMVTQDISIVDGSITDMSAMSDMGAVVDMGGNIVDGSVPDMSAMEMGVVMGMGAVVDMGAVMDMGASK